MKLTKLIVVAVLAFAFLSVPILFAKNRTGIQYFFDKEPFIHPKIIEDLSTSLADSGEQVVSINLHESMGTNRYYGEIQAVGKEKPFVFYEDTDSCKDRVCGFGPPYFGYRLIGKTPADIYVLFIEFSGGGSGRFRDLMFIKFEKGKGLSYDSERKTVRLDRERFIIKKLGEIALGDRYEGEITVSGHTLKIRRDKRNGDNGLFTEDVVLDLEDIR